MSWRTPTRDLFEGLCGCGPSSPAGRPPVRGRHDQVEEIYERGVVLTIDAAAAESLPKPSANPGEIEIAPDDVVPDELHDKLRRAWDRISGKE